MATQEELILAQTRAGASDIYKPKLDDAKMLGIIKKIIKGFNIPPVK